MPITFFHSQVTQPGSSHLKTRACLVGSLCHPQRPCVLGVCPGEAEGLGCSDHQGKVGHGEGPGQGGRRDSSILFVVAEPKPLWEEPGTGMCAGRELYPRGHQSGFCLSALIWPLEHTRPFSPVRLLSAHWVPERPSGSFP